MLRNRIYLVGMPASGKTTIGKLLAEKLSYQFVDLDNKLEEKERKSIPEIFKEIGEGYFRKLEREVLLETLNEKTVIATGGGAPCFFDNMDFIKNNGISVFLNTPVKILADRALKSVGSRPLLKDFDGEKLIEELINKYQQRISYYSQAHIKVVPDINTIPTLLDQLKSF